MEGKSKEEILQGYLWAIKKMRPTLKTLFRAASKSVKDLNGLQLRPQRSFNMREVMERAAMLERAQEIYAASIFLVLDQWIKALSKSLGIDEHQREFGEQIGRARLALLIWATANNFRHHGEWAEPNKLAKVNIKILDAAGVHNVQDSIVSPQVLQVLQVRTYEELEAKVEGIGKDMLARAFG